MFRPDYYLRHTLLFLGFVANNNLIVHLGFVANNSFIVFRIYDFILLVIRFF